MKRFTDTDKWTRDAWFCDLKPQYKLFWFYIVDHCDNVGVWEINIKIANMLIGKDYTAEELLGVFGDKIHVFDDGRKWWIKSFIDFQHGELSEDSLSKPIISYIALLRKHTLWIPYTKSMQSVQGKGKGKGKGTGRGKVINYSDDFNTWWKVYNTGSKANAFKRWNERLKEKDLPAISDLIDITNQYKEHCLFKDRTMKDGEGWINGKFWETNWSLPNVKKPKQEGPSIADLNLV